MPRIPPSLPLLSRPTYWLLGMASFALLGWLGWLGYQQPDILIAVYQGLIGCW